MIPKRDKKAKKTKKQKTSNKKKHHTFSCTAGWRLTIPTILGMAIEGPSRFCIPLTFFDPISSFAAMGY